MRIIAALGATLTAAALLAGCSALPVAKGGPSPADSSSASPKASDAADAADAPTSAATPGHATIAADGSVDVCAGLPLSAVVGVTGQKYRQQVAGDFDTFTAPDYVTSACAYVGSDPSKHSLSVLVSIGRAALAFKDAAAHGGVTPTDGVGDQAETDGVNQLTVRFGDRVCMTFFDASDEGEVGVRNMGALAVILHEAIGD